MIALANILASYAVQSKMCVENVSPSTVCKIIHKHGFTRKKLQRVAKQRSLLYRGEYMAEIQMYDRDCFVFIDETGCSSKDHARKFGYALRGEAAVEHRLVHIDKIMAETQSLLQF